MLRFLLQWARADFHNPLSQFIVRVLGVSSVGSGLEGRTVAYHHGCYALRELRVREEPLTLLQEAGASVVGWEAAEECCGFGGTFAVKQADVSGAMVKDKTDALRATGAERVISQDCGCLMNIGGAFEKQGDGPATQHIAEFLLERTT